MAKYTMEIDTEAKTMSFKKDGEEVKCDSKVMGSYVDTYDKKTRHFMDYQMSDEDGTRISYNYNWDHDMKLMAESNISPVSVIAEAHNKSRVAQNVSRVLTSRVLGNKNK